jgi:hypothetical protein
MGSTTSTPTTSSSQPPPSSALDSGPANEVIQLTPTNRSSNNNTNINISPSLDPTDENPTATNLAASYFAESSGLYFGPHFVVNSPHLTSGSRFSSSSAAAGISPAERNVGRSLLQLGRLRNSNGNGTNANSDALGRMEEGNANNAGANSATTNTGGGLAGIPGVPGWVDVRSGVDLSGAITMEELEMLAELYRQVSYALNLSILNFFKLGKLGLLMLLSNFRNAPV